VQVTTALAEHPLLHPPMESQAIYAQWEPTVPLDPTRPLSAHRELSDPQQVGVGEVYQAVYISLTVFQVSNCCLSAQHVLQDSIARVTAIKSQVETAQPGISVQEARRQLHPLTVLLATSVHWVTTVQRALPMPFLALLARMQTRPSTRYA
jgi:hypothetical protein